MWSFGVNDNKGSFLWHGWLICQKCANIWHNTEMMRSFHPCCLIACPLPTQSPHSPSCGCRSANLVAHPVDMGEEACWRNSVSCWQMAALTAKGWYQPSLAPGEVWVHTGNRAVMLLKINLALEIKIIVITAMRKVRLLILSAQCQGGEDYKFSKAYKWQK